jgi:predicted O-methyltransferase YrrM
MKHFERVREEFDDLPYMNHHQATFLRDLVVEHDVRDILEVGFYHGKSSAYFAAILEDLGRGHLTTMDLRQAMKRTPNIDAVLSKLQLSHRVTTMLSERSYTWDLGKMIRANPRPQFDLCYFDGGHLWDDTGFGFVLVDMLLRPGGWIVFDDLKWTVAAVMGMDGAPKSWQRIPADERAEPAVQLVFDWLVPHLGYRNRRAVLNGSWGVAQKPLEGVSSQAESMGLRIWKRFRRRQR